MTTAVQPRWEAPEVVDPPSTQGLRNAYRRLCDVTGMRTAGWIALLGGVLSLVLGIVFGWLEFTVVGVLAVVTVLICLLFTIGRPKLEVWVQLTDRSVVVDEDVAGMQVAVDAHRRPRPRGSRGRQVPQLGRAFELRRRHPAAEPLEPRPHRGRAASQRAASNGVTWEVG